MTTVVVEYLEITSGPSLHELFDALDQPSGSGVPRYVNFTGNHTRRGVTIPDRTIKVCPLKLKVERRGSQNFIIDVITVAGTKRWQNQTVHYNTDTESGYLQLSP